MSEATFSCTLTTGITLQSYCSVTSYDLIVLFSGSSCMWACCMIDYLTVAMKSATARIWNQLSSTHVLHKKETT